ncbi:unnamed protein product [Owenia fusiformis]|uniref:N-glycosylase/DNA lyase n=1 Tax=Owenia fusiformis TaxID=6347 RepID=A0A8S4NZG3_OWEFU|nr:unnamed protein product [Owenia fusiformis]
MNTWRRLPCKISEVNLDILLACGQSFRWHETHPGEWTGALSGYVWTLSQTDDSILYKVYEQSDKRKTASYTSVKKPGKQNHRKRSKDIKEEQNDHPDAKQPKLLTSIKQEVEIGGGDSVKNEIKTEPTCNDLGNFYNSILHDYFQLDVDLQQLYTQWSKADKNFKKVSVDFSGIRMLRQNPVENLFSFICSSNNHISRISGMVERLCETYGKPITEVDGVMYYAFPDVKSLAGNNVEQKLRELGFGYRAKYISETAKYIVKNHSEEWLYSLRDVPYDESKAQLVKLHGVGAKVADCVCLMSLDKIGAIPVDTHVWQIASRDYMKGLKQGKTLTDKVYKEIGDHFRELWGPYAGWAHSVLFSADLKKFQDKKSPKKTGK